MYYRYQPYPYYRNYYRRYYNIDPYYYRRYYNPYYNIIDSQIANIDQRIDNYGDMTDVIQNANIYQLRSPNSETTEVSSEDSVTAVTEVEVSETIVASTTEANGEITITEELPQINEYQPSPFY